MNMHACTVGHSAPCPQSGRGIALVRTYQSLLKAIGTLNSSNPNLHTHTSRVEAQNLQVTQVAGYCGACHGTLINHPAGGTFPCSACLGILSTTPVGFARIQAQSQTLPGRRKEAKAWPPFRFLRQGVEARPIGNAVGTWDTRPMASIRSSEKCLEDFGAIGGRGGSWSSCYSRGASVWAREWI